MLHEPTSICDAIAGRRRFPVHANGACDSFTLSFARGSFSQSTVLEEQVMSRKPYSLSKQLVVATAVALGASSVALADDSSMNPLAGESYKYFNNGFNAGSSGFNGSFAGNAASDPSWRRSHPNGLPEADLQALSASGLSASASQFNPPILASVSTDPSWRQSHPNGLTEHEIQVLSSSTLAVWTRPDGFGSIGRAVAAKVNVAEAPGKETFLGRFATAGRVGE
jgi:hypothetical protein